MRSEHVGATHGAQYTMRDARTSRSEIIVSCSVASPGGPEVLNSEVLDPVPPHPDFVGIGEFSGITPQFGHQSGIRDRSDPLGCAPSKALAYPGRFRALRLEGRLDPVASHLGQP